MFSSEHLRITCLLAQVLQRLCARQAHNLCTSLAGTVRVLFSQLQELSAHSMGLGQPSDPLGQVRGSVYRV